MGLYDDINLAKYKPSNGLVKTPVPISTPVPVRSSSPAPAPQTLPVSQPTQTLPSTPQKTSGLQKVFDTLAIPSKAYGGYLQGARQDAMSRIEANKSTGKKSGIMDMLHSMGAGFKNIPAGIKNNITPSKAFSEYDRTNPVGTAISKFNSNPAGAFVTDMIADPLNLIPFGAGGKLLGKGGKVVSKVLKLDKIVDFAKTQPLIYKAVETVNPFFRLPEFKGLVEAGDDASRFRLTKLYDKLTDLTNGLTRNDQVHIAQVLERKATPINSKAAKIASEVSDISKQIGQEAVDAGKMTQQVFDDMTAKGYMSHVILDNAPKHLGTKFSTFQKVVGNQFKKRTGKLTENVKEFAPAVFKGLGSEIKDLEVIKVMKNVASKYGEKIGRGGEALPGYVRASDLGIQGNAYAKAFKNLQIPQVVADYLTRMRPANPAGLIEKYQKFVMNPWKAMKTILSPGYHGRNLISNQALSSMGTGKNIVSTTIDYIKRIPEFRSGKSKIYNLAKESGLIGRRSFGSNLDELVDSAGLGTKENLWEKITKYPKKFQNWSEESAKFNVFKTSVEKLAKESGLSFDKALKNSGLIKKAKNIAEEAIFSPYKINPSERSIMSKIIPFYSFTRQALPFTAKTLVNNPKSIAQFGKIKNVIERQSEEPGVELPAYLKNQIRLPTKDSKGNNKYYDPTYVYPFGNFIDSKGLFGLSLDPMVMEVAQQRFNQDTYFQQPIATSNLKLERLKARAKHAFRTVSPALVDTAINKIWPEVVKTAQKDPTARLGDVLLSLLGIKLSTPDINNIQTQNLRSKKATESSIQQEMDQTINGKDTLGNPLTREQQESKLRSLQQLTP